MNNTEQCHRCLHALHQGVGHARTCPLDPHAPFTDVQLLAREHLPALAADMKILWQFVQEGRSAPYAQKVLYRLELVVNALQALDREPRELGETWVAQPGYLARTWRLTVQEEDEEPTSLTAALATLL